MMRSGLRWGLFRNTQQDFPIGRRGLKEGNESRMTLSLADGLAEDWGRIKNSVSEMLSVSFLSGCQSRCWGRGWIHKSESGGGTRRRDPGWKLSV